jgi:hypothetical protein
MDDIPPSRRSWILLTVMHNYYVYNERGVEVQIVDTDGEIVNTYDYTMG